MRHHSSCFAFAVMLFLTLTTGPAASQQPGEREIRQGVIEQITEITLPTNHHRGVGAIIGIRAFDPVSACTSKKR